MMLKVNENEKVNAVVEMIEKYARDKYDVFELGSIYGNKIGFRYTNNEELRILTAAYVYTEHNMKEKVKMTMKIDTKNKVVWINVTAIGETSMDLDTILERIRNVQRIKDIKLERVTKAVERTLEEYTNEIIGIVEDMDEKDFLRVLYACSNEIRPDEKELIITAYASRRKEEDYDNLW